MPPIVEFDHVTKTFSNFTAIEMLNLSIEKGQFVTLLGPSGCGKSTTLRMLGGFETPTSGAIRLAGQDVTHLPPHRRNVNIVFQDYALFPHLTVARNIAFGLELKGKRNSEIQSRVAELLDLVQLSAFADRYPDQLSGGQRQRVALMRALAPDPDVLLLDEPLSALDAKLRQQMQIELKSIQQTTGKTFMFVTHDQEEALTMSDMIVVMNKGHVEQAGDPRTLYARPATRFVAGFIGEANFIDARYLGPDGELGVFDWNGRRVEADLGHQTVAPGETRALVVRPEAIRVSSAPSDEGRWIKGRVAGQVFRGSQTAMTIEVAGGQQIEAVLSPAALEAVASDEVWLGWNGRDAIVVAD